MTRLPLVLLSLQLLLVPLPAARADIVGVTSPADSGPGTLRQAILDANTGACAAPCEIAFVGSFRVDLETELPALTASSVLLRAEPQQTPVRPEATVNGSRAGTGTTGLRILGAKDVRVAGLTFERFDTGVAVRDSEKVRLSHTGVYSNRGDGIVVERSSNVVIEYCSVGVHVFEHTGRQSRPNGGHGIRLHDVRGAAVAASVIRHNAGHGIVVTGDSRENLFELNEFVANGGLSVDLGDDGPNPSVAIETARANSGHVRVDGRVTGLANARYDVSIYTADPDSSGFGEGRSFAGGAPATLTTGGDGIARFTVDLPASELTHVTALATRFLGESWPWGETSEFSNTVAVVDAAITVDVTSVSDSGPGSLRAVIEELNAGECSATFPCHVSFRLDGERTIRPLSPLPPIQRAGILLDAVNVAIDGSSCPGCNGLEITSAERTIGLGRIRGLAIRGFDGHGIVVTGYPRQRVRFVYRVTIETCALTGNGGSGLYVQDAHVTSLSNVIGGNAGDGITVNATTDYGAGIGSGDFIGTDPSGLFPMPNGGHGISGNGSISSGSVIAFNVGHGIHATGDSGLTAGNSIHSNGGRGIARERQISWPVIESARFENGRTRIRYSLDAPRSDFPYRYLIAVYTSSFTDASGRGEAKRFLKTVLIDNSEPSYELEIDENLTGKFVTMTRTTWDGFSLSAYGTSEFGTSVQVTADGCAGGSTALESPADGAEVEGRTTFRWRAVPGAILYRLWMMKPGGAPAAMFDGAAPVATLALEPGTYEWWVETRFDCWGPQTEHRTVQVR